MSYRIYNASPVKWDILGRQVDYRGSLRELLIAPESITSASDIIVALRPLYDQARRDRPDADSFEFMNFDTTLTLARACQKLVPDKSFEIIEVTRNNTSPKHGTVLLGYDLDPGFGDSIIHNAYCIAKSYHSCFKIESKDEKSIIGMYIASSAINQLNNNGLFRSFQAATCFLATLRALHRLWPNDWDDNEEFEAAEVIAMYSTGKLSEA